MREQNIRTEILIGKDAMERISSGHVAVFGAGGVGGYVIEALARSGVGTIEIIDSDTVDPTNLNRQIISLHSTIGILKTEAFRDRIHDINPDINVIIHSCFYLPDKKDEFDFDKMDYIVDAIDTVTAKIDLILEAEKRGIPIISAMGCGNRLDPSKLKITDLYKTSGDPLAKIMRHELRRRGVRKLTVCCSDEEPIKPQIDISEQERKAGKENVRRFTPGSSPFVPPAAGLLIASRVVNDLMKEDSQSK